MCECSANTHALVLVCRCSFLGVRTCVLVCMRDACVCVCARALCVHACNCIIMCWLCCGCRYLGIQRACGCP